MSEFERSEPSNDSQANAEMSDEFSFRLNEGNVKRHTMDRLDSLTTGTAGKRLTYKDLIA